MLTRKWYSVKKKNYTKEEIEHVKNILTVKPHIPIGYAPETAPFHIYAENETKLFVPRDFGIHHFGIPSKNSICAGNEINVEFNGTLRDMQKPIVTSVKNELLKSGHCIMNVPTGVGKCHAINTPILMFDGSIKYVQYIKIGDKIMGDDSTCRIVKSLGRGVDIMYKILLDNGESFIVNSEHILSLKIVGNCIKNANKYYVSYFDIQDLRKKQKIFKSKMSAFSFYINLPKIVDIPLNIYLTIDHETRQMLTLYKNPISFPKQKVPYNPYSIGFWLNNITSMENFDLSTKYYNILKNLNLLNNKYIPNIYKINSTDVRLSLLAGIIDSNSNYKNNYIEIIQPLKNLLNDIIFLLQSLGFSVYKKNKSIRIYGNFSQIPTKKYTQIQHKPLKMIHLFHFNVQKLKKDKYYGFTLDKNHRYVMGDFTVTHNTAMSLYLSSQLKQKTLILVHQDFLLNQWIERITQFLPQAKIGILKRDQIDVEHKDIVIGMIQSICSRNYDSQIFKQFGLTIMDECHHVSSKYFSQVLYTCGSKYMLGLSATPQRKDGLTKVLKWHLGKILSFYNQDIQFNVTIKCIRFVPKYNEIVIKKNHFGGINIANLINQICAHKDRNKLIIDELIYYARMGRQILVLSDRVQHLRDLQNQIPVDISTGLYIGGMKQEERKISETKTIIFGTYILIKEAVDIPSLNTLVLATSKSDIIQAVGRILRKQHPKFDPLIIDIIDEISLFENQSRKRKEYYSKKGYKILDSQNIVDTIEITTCML
jgi:superfamily II DNA or RNA helicase